MPSNEMRLPSGSRATRIFRANPNNLHSYISMPRASASSQRHLASRSVSSSGLSCFFANFVSTKKSSKYGVDQSSNLPIAFASNPAPFFSGKSDISVSLIRMLAYVKRCGIASPPQSSQIVTVFTVCTVMIASLYRM
ncbi:MAG: hypothetical protein P4M11_04890 [Candidatus Pacebacteria bacterium]|nr:hypothetical protein [Candidatus Paceibacterota bacterium]